MPGQNPTSAVAMSSMIRFVFLLLVLIAPPAAAEQALRIAVAANFRAVLEQINAVYETENGNAVVLSSASSGVLATQISHGAPFDLFFSADRYSVEQLLKRGLGEESRCYARGQLVLAGGELADLGNPQMSLAIANPDTAPYGRAAREVLDRPELASATQRQPIRGANVLQAYQFWRAGAVQLALVARSQAPAATPVPDHWHSPLDQHLLVLNNSPAVRAYLQWLGSDTVRQMIIDSGYQPCP